MARQTPAVDLALWRRRGDLTALYFLSYPFHYHTFKAFKIDLEPVKKSGVREYEQ